MENQIASLDQILPVQIDNIEKDTIEKWKALKQNHKFLPYSETRVDLLTPFYGTDDYKDFSEHEKDNLYNYFLMFQAEAFITLEQVLMKAFRSLRKRNSGNLNLNGLNRILREELFHSRAFYEYLNSRQTNIWPEKSLFVRKSRLLRNAMCAIAGLYPNGIALPTAKLEIYTVCYSEFVMNKCQIPRNDYWRVLHTLHWQDENHHVEFDFSVHETEMKNLSLLKTITSITASIFLTLLLQLMLSVSCYRLLKYSLPNRNVYQRSIFLIRMFQWVIWNFEPYTETRRKLEGHFQTKSLRFGSFFSFMYR